MAVNVESIFPANDFRVVADNAAEEIELGLIIGYDSKGDLCVYGGGLIDGKRPTAKDWLWIVEKFKLNLLEGVYAGD